MSLPELFARTRRKLDLSPLPAPDVTEGTADTTLPGMGPALKNFRMETQQQFYWCWAAVSVSVFHFYRPANFLTQCMVATRVLQNGVDCCLNKAPCNVIQPLEAALKAAGVFKGMTVAPLDPNVVHAQISNSKLIGCGVRWPDTNVHFVVIYGITRDLSGTVWVGIDDPRYGRRKETYNDFLTRYRGMERWISSYATG